MITRCICALLRALTESEPCPTACTRAQIQDKLSRLTLDNNGVVRVEEERIRRNGPLLSPLFVKLPFDALCLVLDVVYNNRPIQVRAEGLLRQRDPHG